MTNESELRCIKCKSDDLDFIGSDYDIWGVFTAEFCCNNCNCGFKIDGKKNIDYDTETIKILENTEKEVIL